MEHEQYSESTEELGGRSRFDILDLPESLQQVLRVIIHERSTNLGAIAAQLNQPETTVQPLVDALVAQGFVQTVNENGEQRYQPHLTPKRGRKVPDRIWQRLEEEG